MSYQYGERLEMGWNLNRVLCKCVSYLPSELWYSLYGVSFIHSQKTFLWQVGDDQDVTVMMPMLRTMLNMKAPLFVFKSLDELETDLWRQVDLMNTTTIKSSKCPYGQLGSKLAILSCKMTKNIAPLLLLWGATKTNSTSRVKRCRDYTSTLSFGCYFGPTKAKAENSYDDGWGQLSFSDPH